MNIGNFRARMPAPALFSLFSIFPFQAKNLNRKRMTTKLKISLSKLQTSGLLLLLLCWGASNLSAGAYFYTFRAKDGRHAGGKLIVK